MMDYDDFIEHIYDLDPSELRRLAYEALMISDGPAYVKTDRNPFPTSEGRMALVALNQFYRDILPEAL